MGQSERSSQEHDNLLVRTGAVLGLLLAVLLLGAASASASYEQVADFGKNELLSATQLAVNLTGAGGVPAGTVYAVGAQYERVARYGPDGEFQEAWGWGVGNGADEFQRCGPATVSLDDGFPTCGQAPVRLPAGEGLGQLLGAIRSGGRTEYRPRLCAQRPARVLRKRKRADSGLQRRRRPSFELWRTQKRSSNPSKKDQAGFTSLWNPGWRLAMAGLYT